ncbi:MAG TPA: YHYH protein [Solirubrobacteraceae bacterium]
MFSLALAATVAVAAASSPDPANLPLGDGKVTTEGAKRGWVYRCGGGPGGPGGGAQAAGPWIREDEGTFDATAKAIVDGEVRWAQARVRIVRRGRVRRVVSNGLPVAGITGTFPIAREDDAYQYDRNPNSISAHSFDLRLPARPRRARRASCLSPGPIGIAVNGVPIFDALDAMSRDAVAWETQDVCGGHPERTGSYHYHAIPACLTKGASTSKHSPVVGYALDGFAIRGPRGARGKLLSTSDLDACHGHRHGGSYHYHATLDYPYTLGCLRGTTAN